LSFWFSEYKFIFLATFCALYTMSEQIEVEGTLNIYELAKVYHIKRPGIWRHNVSMEKTNKQTELIFIVFFLG